MIVQFPQIYEDELVYSLFARYHVISGNTSCSYTQEELLLNNKVKVDKEFAKQLKPEIVELITEGKGIDYLINNHTMYPYYGRFIDEEKRRRAYGALTEMQGDFTKLLGIQHKQNEKRRFLRYCPYYVNEDRKTKGETYWHRIHQMRYINVCPVHGCNLIDSSIANDSQSTAFLSSAEQMITVNQEELKKQIKICENETETKLARYAMKVFNYPINENLHYVYKFLRCKMVDTPYISSRGEHAYYHKLFLAMKEYYKDCSFYEEIKEVSIQRMLSGDRTSFADICMIAMLLNISYTELADGHYGDITPEQIFDMKVQKLYEKGLTGNEIARSLGVAGSMVRMSKNITEKPSNDKSGQVINNARSMFDWDTLDEKYYPVVKNTIYDMKQNRQDRPKRITYYAISKASGISNDRLRKMKRCRMIIDENVESMELFYARKIEWSVRMLQQEDKPILWWRIVAKGKIERDVIEKCVQYITDETIKMQVLNCLEH